MVIYLLHRPARSARSRRSDARHRRQRWLLRIGTGDHARVPLRAARRASRSTRSTRRACSSWPPAGLTLSWFEQGADNHGRARRALDERRGRRSARPRSRCVLGTLAAYARRALRLLRPQLDLVPGRAADRAAGDRHRHGAQRDLHAGAEASTWRCGRSIVGHATFCIVIVFNNVVARLRRTPASLEEAAGDLGAAPRGRSATSRSRRCARR